MRKLFYFILFIGVFIVISCTPQLPTIQQTPEITPQLQVYTVRVATFNYASLSKKLEQRDIQLLVKIFKDEQVDIISVQNISRYPQIPSRIDFVTEVSKQLDVRSIFSEMVTSGGKQLGNAIFTTYPIISQHTITFETIEPTSFDAALKVLIDIGYTTIGIVSIQLPNNITRTKSERCLAKVLSDDIHSQPIIATGNLPQNSITIEQFKFMNAWEEKNSNTLRIWYNSLPNYTVKNTKTFQTQFGKVVVCEFAFQYSLQN